MTPSDLRLIQSTFAQIRAMPERFAEAFRYRAVALEPTLAALLPSGSDAPARLLDALGAVVGGFDCVGSAKAKDQAFALHHRWAGVAPRYTGVVGQALLDALATCLGPDFTDAARAACANGFVLVAEAVMARSYNPLGLVA